jgi:hypothetical protein
MDHLLAGMQGDLQGAPEEPAAPSEVAKKL